MEVDRQSMKRSPRKSFELYSSLIQSREITPETREADWERVKAVQGKRDRFAGVRMASRRLMWEGQEVCKEGLAVSVIGRKSAQIIYTRIDILSCEQVA